MQAPRREGVDSAVIGTDFFPCIMTGEVRWGVATSSISDALRSKVGLKDKCPANANENVYLLTNK
jgi:hypothetical protein